MKTLIGMLASHDDSPRNNALARLLDELHDSYRNEEWCKHYAIVMTGGTYDRVIDGRAADAQTQQVIPVKQETWKWLHEHCGIVRLPAGKQGGVTLLACLVAQKRISLLWPFLSPRTGHWLSPENLALIRLADFHGASTYMNSGSVGEWADQFASQHVGRDVQVWPPQHDLRLPGTNTSLPIKEKHVMRDDVESSVWEVQSPLDVRRADPYMRFGEDEKKNPVIALIAHDEMKENMAQFVYDYRRELRQFRRILCTGTTGKVVVESSPALEDQIYRYHSGPKGGDVEIATEVLFGNCQVVVFFVDPLRPHPHTDDIRVVFAACMLQDEVRMFSNERQAREWFETEFR